MIIIEKLLKFNVVKLKSMASRKCYFVNRNNDIKIFLSHNEKTTLGRSVETKIKDKFVSKQQIECIADLENCIVKIKPIGKAVSGVDGYAIVKGKTYTLGPGHIVELRLGSHPFEIKFDCPNAIKHEHVTKKPKLEFDSGSQKKSFFSESGKWEDIDNKELIIYTPEDIQGRRKIAAFDVDGTIIKTKSGARFPKDSDDWVLNYGNIPSKLRTLYSDNFKIVFFTNQSGVGKDSAKIKNFKMKMENVIKKIALPIQVFVALGKSKYRKPITGMWEILKLQKNNNIDIDLTESFYVGDAAGREKNWALKKPKDHSNADRLFALNIGIKFYTPEEYFLNSKTAPFQMPEFDPRNIQVDKDTVIDMDFKTPNMIILVGGPGSGKSHFCKSFLLSKGYVHINRDTLGSWQKCVKLLEEGLRNNKNCVVDNTNIDKESRKRYIEVAIKFNVPCICFVMSTSYQQCKHNIKFREMTDKIHEPVNEIILNTLKKNYEKPELEEGFDKIVEVPFMPNFDNDEMEKLYKMFLLEK